MQRKLLAVIGWLIVPLGCDDDPTAVGESLDAPVVQRAPLILVADIPGDPVLAPLMLSALGQPSMDHLATELRPLAAEPSGEQMRRAAGALRETRTYVLSNHRPAARSESVEQGAAAEDASSFEARVVTDVVSLVLTAALETVQEHSTATSRPTKAPATIVEGPESTRTP